MSTSPHRANAGTIPRGLDFVDRDPWIRALDAQLEIDGDEAAWFHAVRERLEASYLAHDDPYLQSGTRSNAQTWELKRGAIAAAIDRDGSFLDIGCANGLLMESMVTWAAQRGHALEPYGLDISERLADRARTRYPQWADRVAVGNVLEWTPPNGQRSTFVRTEFEYVPLPRWRDLIDHLLANVVAPDGRLIVCSYRNGRRPAPGLDDVAEWLELWGYRVAGEAQSGDHAGIAVTQIAWIDAADPREPDAAPGDRPA